MKIGFLCGSLEPGRDGVGDYVCRLATEIWQQGHQAVAIALNDSYSLHELTEVHPVANGELLMLRLPATWPVARRFARAQEWLSTFAPQWISLQFVSYAFHPKGLPLNLGNRLKPLLRGRQIHVMMHECWVDSASGGIKRRLLSMLQRACIRRLVRTIRPAVLHTHLPLYCQRMEQLGWRVLPLPLFSNIPTVAQLPDSAKTDTFRIGIFSQIDTTDEFIEFIADLAAQITQQQPLQVLLIGGAASRMQQLQAALENSAILRGNVHYTGFLAPTQVSQALQSCHLGLTAVPRHALGKSGTVAAFLAHGIPVAAPTVHPDCSATDVGFFSADLCASILLAPTIESLATVRASARAARALIQLPSITQLFLADLIPPVTSSN